jgi:O-antigen/teichoic acid export membrane protein
MQLVDRLRRRLRDDPRLARVLHGSTSGFVGRGFSLLISLLTLPLTLHYLGKLEYGIWITISTTVVMIGVLDLGIANTLTNLISDAFAHGDPQAAQRYFATAFWLTIGVVVVLAAGSAEVWHVLDWGRLLHVSDPVLTGKVRTAVAISLAYVLLSLPLNLANRVLSGYQQMHLANYFAMINNVLSLAAILTTIMMRGDLVTLMAAYCCAMILGSILLNAWLMVWHKPWMKPNPSRVSREVAGRLFRQGFLFFVIQLTTLVVFNSDNLVITHYLGPSDVTAYSIAWRLAGYASLLQSLLITSFWPAFTEAYRKHEMDWLRKTYHAMEQKTLIAVGSAALLMGLFGRPLIRAWVGDASVPSALLLWTMAAWAMMVSITTNQALLLSATGRLRTAAMVAVVAALVNLGLSIELVQRIGTEGVILSTVLSFAVVMVGPQAWEVRRVLSGVFLSGEPDQRAGAKMATDELTEAG